jgi:hypothetical protein
LKKTLITSGCSFSDCISPGINTWPKHLAQALDDYTHISKAKACQGNGLISRGIIWAVQECLKTSPAEDILVGIMWSGPTRHDFYKSGNYEYQKNIDNWYENPTKFISENAKNWIIMNSHWKNNLAKQYYGLFYDTVGSYIYSYEHILRTQWFLKLNNIKYFMTTYTGEVFSKDISADEDIKHLHREVDWSKFLPIVGAYEWSRDHSGFDFPIKNDIHPGTDQNKALVDRIIMPFIKEKL